jgi:hypothetical protein
MRFVLKGFNIATSIMITNQYVDILIHKKIIYIDSVSISRILDILYTDLIKYFEEDPSLYSFETTISGFNQKLYALNINQTNILLKKLDKSVSKSVAIMEALKNIK